MRIVKMMAVMMGLSLPLAAQNVTAPPPPRIIAPVMPPPVERPAVVGKPYSLTETYTTVSNLSDGSYTNKLQMQKRARDSNGRTWMSTLYKVGNQEYAIVTIDDPVAQERISLNGWSKEANIQHTVPLKPNDPSQLIPKVATEVTHAKTGDKVTQLPKPITSENLGTKYIEGIQVAGHRITRTIPSGRQGSDHETQSIDETWVSPELNIVMESTLDDTRIGKTTTKVTSIDRGEPDAALFRVPEGYKVIDKNPNAAAAQP